MAPPPRATSTTGSRARRTTGGGTGRPPGAPSTTCTWSATSPIAGRNSQFEIRYDLPERVVPASTSRRRPRASTTRSERSGGRHAPTASAPLRDLADYYRLRSVPGQSQTGAAPIVEELVEEGELIPVTVEGVERQSYLHRDARIPRRVARPHPAEPVRPGGVGARPHRGALRLLLPDRDLHPGREAHPRLLRAAVPAGRPDRRPGRPQGRPQDRVCCWSRRRTPSRARPTRPPRSSRSSCAGWPDGSAAHVVVEPPRRPRAGSLSAPRRPDALP